MRRRHWNRFNKTKKKERHSSPFHKFYLIKNSKEEMNEIDDNLSETHKNGVIELNKIYMNETITD